MPPTLKNSLEVAPAAARGCAFSSSEAPGAMASIALVANRRVKRRARSGPQRKDMAAEPRAEPVAAADDAAEAAAAPAVVEKAVEAKAAASAPEAPSGTGKRPRESSAEADGEARGAARPRLRESANGGAPGPSAHIPVATFFGLRREQGAQATQLREQLFGVLGSTRRDELPGPLPATLNREALATLRNQLFWVCEKSDGVRAMLLLLPQRAYLVDRALAFYALPPDSVCCRLSSRLTLLDGELIEGPEPVYLAYDCVRLDDAPVSEQPLSQRLAAVSRVVQRFRELLASAGAGAASKQLFKLLGKRLLPKEKAGIILQSIRRLGRGVYEYSERRNNGEERRNLNDGLIFTPEAATYGQLMRRGILKWKWLEKNTVDFAVGFPEPDSEGVPQVELKARSCNEDIVVRRAPLTREEAIMVEKALGVRPSIVVECVFDKERGRWTLLGVRSEKQNGNSVFTMMSCLEVRVRRASRSAQVHSRSLAHCHFFVQAMIENVTLAEICEACGAECPEMWRR
jgi:mRNA guanylyltransferase